MSYEPKEGEIVLYHTSSFGQGDTKGKGLVLCVEELAGGNKRVRVETEYRCPKTREPLVWSLFTANTVFSPSSCTKWEAREAA